MNLTTLQYRIKEQTTGKHLTQMGYSCNYVWNFCNQSNVERWSKFRKTFSAFDLNKLTTGCGKELGLHSQTIQAVCEEYAKAGKQVERVKLNRSGGPVAFTQTVTWLGSLQSVRR